MPEQTSLTRPCLALLTDFGLKEPYVGQLKAVVCRECPNPLIIDISHEVPPFNIRMGAYFLAASAPRFPAGTIFMAIVDPGVGSSREIIILQTASQIFLGPNNALLSMVERDEKTTLWQIAQPEKDDSCQLFAGRDIIAPVAAKLLNGKKPEEIASPMLIEKLRTENWAQAQWAKGFIDAEALHVDRFGNVIINMATKSGKLLEASGTMLCRFKDKEYPLFRASYYAQIPMQTLALIPGSQGFMEIAMNRSSAARFMGLDFENEKDLKISILC